MGRRWRSRTAPIPWLRDFSVAFLLWVGLLLFDWFLASFTDRNDTAFDLLHTLAGQLLFGFRQLLNSGAFAGRRFLRRLWHVGHLIGA